MTTRRAFTAIELITVMGIMAALAGLALPSVLSAMAAARIAGAADTVARASDEARRRALRTWDQSRCYGVVVVNPADGSPSYAAVTFGTVATPATIVARDGVTTPAPQGEELLRLELPRGGRFTGIAAAGEGWLFRSGSGHPISSHATTLATTVGTPGGRIPELGVQVGARRTRIAVHEIGSCHLQPVTVH